MMETHLMHTALTARGGGRVRVTVGGDGAVISGEDVRVAHAVVETPGRTVGLQVPLYVGPTDAADGTAAGIAHSYEVALANVAVQAGGPIPAAAIVGTFSDGCSAELAAAHLLGVDFPSLCVNHTLALVGAEAGRVSEQAVFDAWVAAPGRPAAAVFSNRDVTFLPLLTYINTAVARQFVHGSDRRGGSLVAEWLEGNRRLSGIVQPGHTHQLLRRESSLSHFYTRIDEMVTFLKETAHTRKYYGEDGGVLPPDAANLLVLLEDPDVRQHLARVVLYYSAFLEKTRVFASETNTSMGAIADRLNLLATQLEVVAGDHRRAPSVADLMKDNWVADKEFYYAILLRNGDLPLPALLRPEELARCAWHSANVGKNPHMFDAANAARRTLAAPGALPLPANVLLLAKMAALGCTKIRDRHYDFIHPLGRRYKTPVAFNTPPTTNNQEGFFAAARQVVLGAPATKQRRMMAAALLVRYKAELWPFIDGFLAGTLCIDPDEGRQGLAARDRREVAAAQQKKAARDGRRAAHRAALAARCGTLLAHCAANIDAFTVPRLRAVYQDFNSLKNVRFRLPGAARVPSTRQELLAAIQQKIALVQPFLTVGNQELY